MRHQKAQFLCPCAVTWRKAMWGDNKMAAVPQPRREASPETKSANLDIGLLAQRTVRKWIQVDCQATQSMVFCYGCPSWLMQLALAMCVLVCAQSCPALCDSMDCSLPGFSVHGIFQARTATGVGCHFLLQGIFLAQRSNLYLLLLLHWRWILFR